MPLNENWGKLGNLRGFTHDTCWFIQTEIYKFDKNLPLTRMHRRRVTKVTPLHVYACVTSVIAVKGICYS